MIVHSTHSCPLGDATLRGRIKIQRSIAIREDNLYGVFWPAVLDAWTNGECDVINNLLRRYGENRNLPPLKESLMLIAARHHSTEPLKVLLEVGKKHQSHFQGRQGDEGCPLQEFLKCRELQMKYFYDTGVHECCSNCPHRGTTCLTALMLAARDGKQDHVDLLLEAGVDVNKCTRDGETALSFAVRGNHVAIVRDLIACGANAQQTLGPTGLSALEIAAQRGHSHCVRALLNGRKCQPDNDPNKPSPTARVRIHRRARSSWVRRMYQVTSHSMTSRQSPPSPASLVCAAEHGQVESMNVLLRYGVKYDLCHDDVSRSLLQAAQYGHVLCMRHLVDGGADINSRDSSQRTALLLATAGGHLETVEFLLEAGAEVNARDIYNQSPISVAARGNHHEILLALLRHAPAFIDQRCNALDDMTLLNYYVPRRHPSHVLEALLAMGADVNTSDVIQRTPVTMLVSMYRPSPYFLGVLKRLLRYGADPDLKGNINARNNVQLYAPLSIAVRFFHHHQARMLWVAGSSLEECQQWAVYTRTHDRLPVKASCDFPDDWRNQWDITRSVLQEMCAEPKSLKVCCRDATRKSLGMNIPAKVKTLPLPSLLKEAILLPELDDIVTREEASSDEGGMVEDPDYDYSTECHNDADCFSED